MVISAASKMVCHECDLLVGMPALEAGQKAFCPRCNFLLAANRPHAFTMILAFAISGMLFLALAIAFPFLGFSAGGQHRTVTLLQSIAILATKDLLSMAAIIFVSIIFIPGAFLTGIAYVMISIRDRRAHV